MAKYSDPLYGPFHRPGKKTVYGGAALLARSKAAKGPSKLIEAAVQRALTDVLSRLDMTVQMQAATRPEKPVPTGKRVVRAVKPSASRNAHH